MLLRNGRKFVLLYFCIIARNSVAQQQTYYWEDGHQCISDCAYKGKDYKWCWTTDGSWRKCSNSLARNRDTTGYKTIHGYDCVSECDKFGSDYYWCATDTSMENGLKWDKCSRTAGYSVYGKLCFNNCERQSHFLERNAFSCNVKTSNYYYLDELCSTVAESQTQDMHKCQVPIKWLPTAGYDPLRYRRSIDDIISDVVESCRSNNHAASSMNRITDRVNQLMRDIGPGIGQTNELIPSSSSTNAVTRVIRRLIAPNIYRTEYLNATITRDHLRRGAPRQAFVGRCTSSIYMRNNLDLQEGDKRGHLLADSLGGPMESYNLVSQAREVNRGRGLDSGWFQMERLMREYFETGRPGAAGGYINYCVSVAYDNSSNQPNRPYQFSVIVAFRESDGSLTQAPRFLPRVLSTPNGVNPLPEHLLCATNIDL